MSDVHVVLDRTRPCRGCGQEIAFIKTAMEKTMPVEPEGVTFAPDGEYKPGSEVFVMMDGTIQRGVRDENGAGIGFVSHFARCPAGKQLRGRKNKSERRRTHG